MSDEKAPIRAERGMEIVDNIYVYLLGEVSPCASIPITERDVPWNVSLCYWNTSLPPRSPLLFRITCVYCTKMDQIKAHTELSYRE